MAQIIMGHGVPGCFGTKLAPERYLSFRRFRLMYSFSANARGGSSSGSRFSNSYNSAAVEVISLFRALISSIEVDTSMATRFLLNRVALSLLKDQSECKSSFLFSATFVTLFKIDWNSLRSAAFGIARPALCCNFSTKCLVCKSFVITVPVLNSNFQSFQANASSWKCSHENPIVSFPRASSYGPLSMLGGSGALWSNPSDFEFLTGFSSPGKFIEVTRRYAQWQGGVHM